MSYLKLMQGLYLSGTSWQTFLQCKLRKNLQIKNFHLTNFTLIELCTEEKTIFEKSILKLVSHDLRLQNYNR